MKRKLTPLGGLVVGASIALATVTLTAVPASATDSTIPVQSRCAPGWYVNPDEGKLAPKVTPAGFLFDGPSLMHHAITAPMSLASMPLDASFTTWGPVTGAKPLFKLETTKPYSTVNVTSDGKYWSSKISSGDGSQSAPVVSPTALGKLAPYTADTLVYSFGVGYANDTGKKALVTSVHFGGTTYGLKCQPHSPSPTATATPSPKPTTPAPTTPGGEPTTPGPTPTSVAGLPVTGPPTGGIIAAGVGVVFIGALVLILSRRRRTRFTA